MGDGAVTLALESYEVAWDKCAFWGQFVGDVGVVVGVCGAASTVHAHLFREFNTKTIRTDFAKIIQITPNPF